MSWPPWRLRHWSPPPLQCPYNSLYAPEALVQFGGKIGAHNLQKFGTGCRPGLGELPHVLQIPNGNPGGPAAASRLPTDHARIEAELG